MYENGVMCKAVCRQRPGPRNVIDKRLLEGYAPCMTYGSSSNKRYVQQPFRPIPLAIQWLIRRIEQLRIK